MKPHLTFASGMWWIGPREGVDYLWAYCAGTVREVCAFWRRVHR